MPSLPLLDWLEQNVPLRHRRYKGIIFASGSGTIPPQCHEGTEFALELILTDCRGTGSCHKFVARLDRSVLRTYLPKQQPIRRDSLGLELRDGSDETEVPSLDNGPSPQKPTEECIEKDLLRMR